MRVQSTRAEEERAADAGFDQPLRFVPAPRILDILHHGDEAPVRSLERECGKASVFWNLFSGHKLRPLFEPLPFTDTLVGFLGGCGSRVALSLRKQKDQGRVPSFFFEGIFGHPKTAAQFATSLEPLAPA